MLPYNKKKMSGSQHNTSWYPRSFGTWTFENPDLSLSAPNYSGRDAHFVQWGSYFGQELTKSQQTYYGFCRASPPGAGDVKNNCNHETGMKPVVTANGCICKNDYGFSGCYNSPLSYCTT